MRRDRTFHTILREQMKQTAPFEEDDIIDTLRRSYRDFYGLDEVDPDPDVWVVIEAWIRSKLD